MLEVWSHDLRQILSEAALFAHKDGVLPSINCVLLEFDGSNLVAIATDRFKLGISRMRVEIPDDQPEDQKQAPFTMSIRLDEVKMLADHLKTPRGFARIRQTTLQVGDDSKTINVADSLAPNIFSFTNYNSAEMTVKVTPVSDRFPNWRPLMAMGADDAEQVACIGLDPLHLAPFFRVAQLRGCHHAQLVFRGYNKPVVVHMDADFAGLIMPIRLHGDTTVPGHADWLQTLIDGATA